MAYGYLPVDDLLELVLHLGPADDLEVLGSSWARAALAAGQLGGVGGEFAVGELPAVGGDDVAVLGAQGTDRGSQPEGGGRQQLAPHPGADDPDRVPQRPDRVRTAGRLRVGPLRLGLREHDVHALERDVEVVGDHHADRGR